VTTVICALFGLLIGSFLNVVIHRVPRGLSIVRPASRCGSCGTGIRPRDNIPVLSWLLLRGRCRACAAPISVRYPAIEVLGGLSFGGCGALIGPRWVLVGALIGVAVAIAGIGIVIERRHVRDHGAH
jgi:leader peptidase (prepilin peptidase) / N-methyltransferase